MTAFFFCPCPRGLEDMLGAELVSLGGREVKKTGGGVSFRGNWTHCYGVNLESRLATRVLWRVAQARYRNESDLYRLAYETTWAKWFSPDQSIRVYVTARHCPLKSLEFVTLKVKDAICDHFRAVKGRRPNVDTHQPDMRIHVFLGKDEVTLYLDTSGEPLLKRGFKQASVAAPLKENLAAGILRASGWTPGMALVDPMCGSGTFLIEAAQMTLDIAPGLGRKFAFEQFAHCEQAAWRQLRLRAKERCQPLRALPLYGADVSADQLRRARINLQAAGLETCVQLQQIDFLNMVAPSAEGVVVMNPPYGARLGDSEALAEWYPLLGDALKRNWSGWRCHILSADTGLPRMIGLKASHRLPLYNGALECRVYEYRMVAGSMRTKRKEA